MIRQNFSTRLFRNWPLIILFAFLMTACKQEQVSHDDIVKADLLAIIESLGSSCGEVLEYQSSSELGYTIQCESGDKYLISVDPQGRVGVESHK